jgi:hypothetical protein
MEPSSKSLKTTKEIQMTVNKINCAGFGAHNQYEMNMKRNRKNDFEVWCEHCAKAMDETAGWLVRWNVWTDCLVPFAEEQENTFIKRVGNECVKRFLSSKEEYEVFAQRVCAI